MHNYLSYFKKNLISASKISFFKKNIFFQGGLNPTCEYLIQISKKTMEIKEVNRLIKGLLTDKLSWEEKKELSHFNPIEEKMKRQWHHSAETATDNEMKERVWKRLEKCRKTTQTTRFYHSLHRFLIAASVILFILGGSLWFLKQNRVSIIDYTANQALMYMLPDSTKVWMQAGANIRYAEEFECKREVWLEGEALFDVTKGKRNNFIVHISKAFIEVKGTSFQIKKNKNMNEITLFEGHIDFNTIINHRCISMKPLEKIIYDPETANVTIEKVEHINWENGRYLFNDITLEQLIEIINDKYSSQIIIGKEINKEYKYTGSLYHNEPLEEIIKKICFSMELNAKSKGEEILIFK